VFHFAALAYVGESMEQPSLYYKNNVCATWNLLDLMVKHGVKLFIFSSTCATYGEPQWLPLTEDHPQNPISPYGRTKLVIEWMLEDFREAYGLKYVNLRYFNAAGADPEGEVGEWHEPETHLIPNILLSLLYEDRILEVYGNDYPTPDGTCIRDYIHIHDLCRAHLLALDYLLDGGEPTSFNLGNGEGYSILDIIKATEKVTGKKVKFEYRPRRPGDPARLIGSAEKAEKVLGWKSEFGDIETIIETAWNWHRKAVERI
ncbi:MAG TPA: UDP-glucose 4-epimerase GalE, partial [Deltaproteobacteria bacterium]|nr:UDP-glucose 4-epimerase GalE [Deltaproteobacteria bacterium]